MLWQVKKERISIACNIGWHVTSPEKALMMLNGVQPISKGLVEFGDGKELIKKYKA